MYFVIYALYFRHIRSAWKTCAPNTNIVPCVCRYPVKTSRELITSYELDFPAVTLCNMSPVRASAYRASKTHRRKRSLLGNNIKTNYM